MKGVTSFLSYRLIAFNIFLFDVFFHCTCHNVILEIFPLKHVHHEDFITKCKEEKKPIIKIYRAISSS